MKMLLLTQKKGFESEQKGMRTNTPEGFDLRKKCWRMLALTKKTRFAGSESFQTWGYPKIEDD